MQCPMACSKEYSIRRNREMYNTLANIIKYALQGDTDKVKHWCDILLLQIDTGMKFKKGVAKEQVFSKATLDNIVEVLAEDKEE
jgi:heterodisulfide reductase subunit B